jgi:glycosyltransferase involved in cell wall biosynthesis
VAQISVIITCFNQKNFIRDAMDSALAQRSAGEEVIVVDDASSDGSLKILEEYAGKIHLIKSEKNQGACAARNAGASASTGNFLVFLDGDDFLLPWALATYRRIIELKTPKIILCRLHQFRGPLPAPQFSNFGREIQIAEYDALVRKSHPFGPMTSAFVIERSVFEQAGGFASEMFCAEGDDLSVKIGCSGRTIHILSHPTAGYRIHENNTIHQVSRFVDAMHKVIHNEKMGLYPGGPRFRRERYACIGSAVIYWFRRAMATGNYRRAAKLLASGWLMFLVALASKLHSRVMGHHPAERIAL